MPIKTNMTSLKPRRQAYKKEIQLLSKGFSAPQAWPEGRITVYPWDSEIDAFLLDQTKHGKGNLLYGILERVCHLNGASVDQFVFSEINTVLLLSRAIQFDGIIEYESSCPFCKATDREKIQVPHELEPIAEKAANYPGYDDITLPDCKDVVRIRPLLVKDHKKIEDRLETEGWQDYTQRHLEIYLPIVAVNGGTPDNMDEVANYYQALSPNDARFLEEQESALSPRLDNRIPHQCKKCSKTFFHTLMFDQEFFRPRGGGQPAPASKENVRAGVGREGVQPKPGKT